jgi:hypothetical protein
MANLLKTMRSAVVQAGFNERMAKFVSYEIAWAAIIGSVLLAYWFGWQWFFWGIILIPVLFGIGISIPIICDIIYIAIAMAWALPFIFIGAMGISACYVGAVIAFVIAIWIHAKAFTFYSDLSN